MIHSEVPEPAGVPPSSARAPKPASVTGRAGPKQFHRLTDRKTSRPLARREVLERLQIAADDRHGRRHQVGVLDEPPLVVARLVLRVSCCQK